MRWGWEKGEGDVDGDRLPPPHLHRGLSLPAPCPQRHLLDSSASGSEGIARGHEGHPELSSHSRCPRCQHRATRVQLQREGPSGSFVKTSTMQ